MGKYMKKCKATSEVAVMEVAAAHHHHHHHHQVGVRMTRARTLAMAKAAEAANSTAKRRKVELEQSLNESSPYLQLRSKRRLIIKPEESKSENSTRCGGGGAEVVAAVPSENRCSSSPSISDNVPASRCSSNGSSMLLNESLLLLLKSSPAVDLLEGEGSEFENSTNFDCRERRETTPSSSGFRAEPEDLSSSMERQSEGNSSHRSTEYNKMPSEAEIEDFFSAAEEQEQKRFTNKYNFDVVKDLPMEGRFEWVPLTQ